MSFPYAKAFLTIVNFPQMASAALLALFSYNHRDFSWSGGGPGFSYTAYTMLIISASQLLNIVIIIVLRKDRGLAKFAFKFGVASFVIALAFMWLGNKFQYWPSSA